MKKQLLNLFFAIVMMIAGIGSAYAESFKMGITRTLDTSAKTASEAVFSSENNLVTVTKLLGPGEAAGYTNRAGLYTSSDPGNNYTVADFVCRNNTGVQTAYNDDVYCGFTLNISDGYTLNLSKLDVSIFAGVNDISYKVIIEDSNGEIYNSGEYKVASYSGSIKNSAFTKNLTLSSLAGEVKVKLYYHTNTSSSKYLAAEKLQLTGELVSNSAPKYTITTAVSPADAGVVTPANGTEVYEGGSVTLNASANSGYAFKNWTDSEGNEVSTDASYTINNVSADINLTANFEETTSVAVSWTMSEGTTNPAYEVSVDNVVSTASFSLGSEMSGQKAQTGYNSVVFTTATPSAKVNDKTSGHSFSWAVDLKNGLTFTPTKVSADICRFGTGGGLFDIVVSAGDVSKTLATGVKPIRNNGDAGEVSFELDITGFEATSDDFYLTVYVYSLDAGKHVGFANVKIEGEYAGTIIEVPQYTVTTSVSPAEAGTITQSPAGSSFDEGTAVSFTANANTGYKFVNWTDSESNVISENATYEIAALSANVNIIANFEKQKLVTYALGTLESVEGAVPEVEYVDNGGQVTIPTNKTLYKEGYTLTGWTDGNTTYNIGAKVTITEDVTLTPVFTENTVSLAKHDYEPITANWYFGPKNGAPALNYQGKKGILVTQVSVEGVTMDLKLDLDGTNGKIYNIGRSDEWAQVNNGTIFSFPSCQGAIVTITAYNELSSTSIEGSTDYAAGKTISYTISGTDAKNTIVVGGDASYISLVKVVYPATADWETVTKENGSEKNVDNVGTSYTVPGAYIAGGESGNNISDGLKIRTGQTAGEVTGFRITPNAGYKLKHIRLVGNSNYDEAVTIEGVYADGDYVNNIISESLVLTDKTATSACNLLIKNVNAVNTIDFACTGGTQANLLISVCYEPIEDIVLTINESGYSTFYANHAVAVPAGLTAYVGALSDAADYLSLVELTEGYIPAQTGVVLAGEPGSYDMRAYTKETEAVESDLSGVAVRTAASNFSGSIYALTTIDSETAFYQYTGSYIPANKAFLVLPAAAAAPKVRIATAETGIEGVTAEQHAADIYNLQGQKVEQVKAPGLYIVGGKKVLVK